MVRFIETGKTATGLLHDLAGPITALSLQLTQMRQAPDQKVLRESQEQIQILLDLIQRQMHISSTKEKTFSLSSLTQNTITLLSHKAITHDVRLITIGESDIELFGKEMRLYRALINIVSNAIDAYTDTETERRDVVIKSEKFSDYICISVTDFGCGISKKDQRKILRYFYTNKEHGTGIGLAMVNRIVRKEFGGTLYFESAPNNGSVFYIRIPIKRSRK